MTDSRKKILGLDWKEFCVLLVYVATEICAAWRYQPWEDEGRAWMIARSNGLLQMLFHVLRYEGHPALWYVILWGPAHGHIPYLLMTRIGVLSGIATVYVLLRYCPLPFPIRAVLPFGFWLAFQYSVVFRSYILFPLLGFVVVSLYRKRERHPILLGCALALLANVSIHGAIVAFGFALAYGWRLWSGRGDMGRSDETARGVWAGAGIFAGSLVFVVICIWPPQNLRWPFTPTFHRLFPTNKQVVTMRTKVEMPNLSLRGVMVRTAFDAQTLDANPGSRAPREDGINQFWKRAGSILGFSVSSSLALAIALETLLVVMLYQQKKLELMLPLVLLIAFLGAVYVMNWHQGLVWVTLLMVVWAAWDETPMEPGLEVQRWFAWVLLLVGVLQILWTISTIRYEQTNLTYPAEALAKYLHTLPRGTTIDGNGLAFTVYPYFDRAIFVDHGDGRFSKRTMDPMDEPVDRMMKYGTEVIILRSDLAAPGQSEELGRGGYREAHRFCGNEFYPQLPPPIKLCLSVYEK